MKRNSLKIVCNPYTNKISYYFMNEQGVWIVLSGNSPLSRQFYTNTTIKERVREILQKADEVYNRKNKGLDILFEGTSENFEILSETVSKYFFARNIACALGVTKIAVIGKTGVGKTSLIEGMEDILKYKYTVDESQEYFTYTDENNHAEWYEIKGITLGFDNIGKACYVLSKLVQNGLSVVVYCLSATSGKIDPLEKDFLLKIIDVYPKITVLVAITNSITSNVRDFADVIEKVTDQIKVVITLAKPYEVEVDNSDTGKDRKISLRSYGLEKLSEYIFERR